MRKCILLFSLIVLIVVPTFSHAEVPGSMNVQGRLTDASGVPLPAGLKTFSFGIYSDSVGGTLIWPEFDPIDHQVYTDDDGLWNAVIGPIFSIGWYSFRDSTRYLQIGVDDGSKTPIILPRVRFRTGPYAYTVGSIDRAWGGNIRGKLNVGTNNSNPADHAFVAGEENQATGTWSSVTGGSTNLASGSASSVAGGSTNATTGGNAFIGGGSGNWADGSNSTIVAGSQNQATGNHSAVVDGYFNFATGDGAFIGGGAYNKARGDYSVVAGGGGPNAVDSNHASGSESFIGAGRRNRAEGAGSVVGGGFQNRATMFHSLVLGGSLNGAIDTFTTVCGGTVCTASGKYAFVGGGSNNTASGRYSTVPGGYNNKATGNYAFSAGYNARASHSGTFVWSDSASPAIFESTGKNQFLIRSSTGVGINTNAPEAPLHVFDGSAGSVTANAQAVAVLERNTESWLHILSPDDEQRGILFGSPSNSLMGSIRFNPSTERKGFHFRCGNNSVRMELDSLGNLAADGCVTGSNIACPSDLRLKDNVETVNDALDIVNGLRGVRFDWKTDEHPERAFPDGRQLGVIAQEVQTSVPEAIIEQDDGYLSVDYTRLVPLLIEGMKEQQRQINELKSEIEQLRQ